jgi:hypothetical protein
LFIDNLCNKIKLVIEIRLKEIPKRKRIDEAKGICFPEKILITKFGAK